MSSDEVSLRLPNGDSVSVHGTTVIGRGAEADIVIDDQEVSRRHASFQIGAEGVVLSDLGSRNGTFLNDVRLRDPQPLNNGDTIRVGRTKLSVTITPRKTEPFGIVPPSSAPSALHLLARISRQISGVLDAKQLSDTVTSTIQQEYGVEGVSLILVDEPSESLYFASAAGIRGPAIKAVNLRMGEGIAGWVAEHREAVLVKDAQNDPRHAKRIDTTLGFTTRSLICVPVLSVQGDALGVLEAVNPTIKSAFDDNDLEFLSLVAQQVAISLSNSRSWGALEQEREALSLAAGVRRRFVAGSPAMVRLISDATSLYAEGTPLYLTGEPNTGKRLLAQITHEAAQRTGAFVEVECRNRPAEELDRQLFAPEGGVLTGSSDSTVFLHSVTDAPAQIQARIGQFLNTVSPDKRPRLIASGRSPLLSELSAGRLAADLYAVLEPGQLILPPLRSRLDELDALVDAAVTLYCQRFDREPFTFTPDAMTILRTYTWPGNLDELHSVIKRLAVLTGVTTIGQPELERLVPEILQVTGAGRTEPLNATQRRRVALQTHAMSDLAHEDPARRHEALALLERSTDPVHRQAVARTLEDPVSWVRARAADALATMGIENISDALIGRLTREDDPTVAARLIEVLAASREPQSLDAIAQQVASPHSGVRKAALAALRRSGNRERLATAAASAGDPSPEVRAEALGALHAAGRMEAAPQLAQMLADANAEAAVAACGVAGELGICLNELVADLGRPEPTLRAAAVRALGMSRRPEVAPVLLQALNDPQVRSEAVRALGDLGAPSGLPALMQVASSAESAFLRRAAVESIGILGERSAVPQLILYLSDRALAGAALDALVAIGDASAEDAVITLLRDNDSALVESAIRALGIIGTDRAVRPLLLAPKSAGASDEALFRAILAIHRRSNSPKDVIRTLCEALTGESERLTVLQMLGEIGDPDAVPWLLEYLHWSEEAAVSLLKIGKAAVPQLLRTAQDDPTSRDDVGRLLTEIGPDVMRDVLPLLLDRDLTAMAESVIRSFGEESVPEVVAALESAGDPTLVARLVQLLGRSGASQISTYLAGFLDHSDSAVQYAAIIALGDLRDQRTEARLLTFTNSEDDTAAALAILSLGRLRSEAALARFPSILDSKPGWRRRYAIAAALANYTDRSNDIADHLHALIQDGLPYTASAVTAHLINTDELLGLLRDQSTTLSRKLRALSLLTELPDEEAVPALTSVLTAVDADGIVQATVSALAERGNAAVESIVEMLADPNRRRLGLAILRELKPPSAVVSVLRRLAVTVQVDQQLRIDLQDMGELLIGPLFDRIYEDWDLDTLTLLWSVAQIVHGEANDLPRTVQNFTVLQQRFEG